MDTNELATTAIQTTDGNYVLIAPSFNEIWIGKFNGSGTLLWQKRYPRTYYDDGLGKYLTWAKPTSDGGFILADEIDGPGGTSRDILFAKFDGNGNLVCGRVLYTFQHDVGIDVVEGPDYYYMTGFFRNSDIFLAAFDKSNCQLVKFRYVQSSADEFGITVDISNNDIPYVGGSTNNGAWSAGGYDGLIAADSGGVDTCYWRSYSISNNVLSLTNSGSWSVWTFTHTPTSYFVATQNVNVGVNVVCGLALGPEDDSELSAEEKKINCRLSYALVGKEIRIKVVGETDLTVSLYSVDGRRIFNGHLKNFSGLYRVPVRLRRGVYFLHIVHGGGETRDRLVVR